MKVIGTAGHIDHGKSTLVRRLTGIDPDRLAEEKARGMTIDLGFAWLTLPSGRRVSVVDVPGHERFVKNMAAGVGGIDLALMVVAADESVMPQTREHLDILDLLGVDRGVVALSKVDLVDEDWRELAAMEVADALAGTALAGSPVVPVSAVTGEGLDLLLAELDCALAAAPDRADRGFPYLPVDRSFSIAGFGTVLTGTLHDGSLLVGQDVVILPGGRRGRIRGLQTHRQSVERAEPGARVAVNVAGLARQDVVRGDTLALPDMLRAAERFDARIRLLADSTIHLASGTQVALHIGAAERNAVLHLLDRSQLLPGEAGWARLRLDAPVAAVRGQRFILRLPSPVRTVAGGEVVDVVPRRRGRVAEIRRLEGLSSGDLLQAARVALPADRPAAAAQLAQVLGAPVERTREILERLEAAGEAVRLGSSFISAEGWLALTGRIDSRLRTYHAAHPLEQGMPKEELRRRLGWRQQDWPAALRLLEAQNIAQERGTLVALPAHRGGSGGREVEAERVLDALRRTPFSPPPARELLDETGSDEALLAALWREGKIVRVGPDLYFARDSYERMVNTVLELIMTGGEVTVSQVRDALHTSRKYALALLEHLDAERVTRRVGDARLLGTRAPRCA